MAEKLTDRTIFSGTVDKDNDLIHLVDVSDTSQDPSGSSFSCVPKKFINSYISSGSETEGQTLYYDATTGKFLNTSNVHIDDSNNFVGVGITSALTAKLHVKSASGTAFQVDGSSITGTFKVQDSGQIDGYLVNISATVGQEYIAIGKSITYTTNARNIAIGYNTNVIGGIAIGYNAYSQSVGGAGTTVGVDSNSTTESTAIGSNAKATTTGSTCLGFQSGSTSGSKGTQFTAIGSYSHYGTANIGEKSIAIGILTNATVTNSYSLGNNVSATQQFAIALGTGNTGLGTQYVNNIGSSFGVAFDSTSATILLAKSNDSFIDNGTNGFVFGASTVNASAKVQIDSTTKGFLPPRMTTTQRDNIATPAEGLVIYNTTTQVLNFYNGTVWGAV